ncbi:MAG: xanthine dehydrogenase family protein molybdopterin-binding subunit [Pseudomonadota bacterium]
MSQLNQVGHSLPRRGGLEKVTGRALFGVDLAQPGDLHLHALRAGCGPARVRLLDVTPALAQDGVVAVFASADIPGVNRVGIIAKVKDQPILAEDEVRYPGDAVALLAATSLQAARAAARLIRLELEPLPGLHDPGRSLEPGAPRVGENGNLLWESRVRRGQPEEMLARAAVVVTNTYTTSRAEHAAIEPEGGRAWLEDGLVVVKASTQNPHHDRMDLARLLGLPEEKVRVIQAETGGGFGGKLDLGLQGFLALAAWRLQRPVVMSYTREESLACTAKRHGLVLEYTTAADDEGRLIACQAEIFGDSGVYASYGPAVCVRAAVHAAGPYRVPHVQAHCRLVYTNNAWCGAMRGFGVPQVALAHEGQMDELAQRLGIDPLEMRIKNALRPGDITATGQRLGQSAGLVQCLEALRPHYRQMRAQAETSGDGRWLRGVGLGAMFYGIGNTAMSNPASAVLEIDGQGCLSLRSGAAELGQGSDTVLCQIAAEALGWPAEMVRLVRGDTAHTLNAGATSASRQTFISGNAVLLAAQGLRSLLLERAGLLLDAPPQEITLDRDGASAGQRRLPLAALLGDLEARGVPVQAQGDYDPPTSALDPATGQGEPYPVYAFAAQAALVEVDQDSGLTRVPRVAAAHDVGRAVNPRGVEAQIVGGVVMGLGYALMEEYTPHCTNLHQYHIPTVADAPEVITMIVETEGAAGPYGAKGVGEPALIPTAPAVAGGLCQALGRRLYDQPFSLERVMAALVEREKDEAGS